MSINRDGLKTLKLFFFIYKMSHGHRSDFIVFEEEMIINCGSETSVTWIEIEIIWPLTPSLRRTAQLQAKPFRSERLHWLPRPRIPSRCLLHQQVRMSIDYKQVSLFVVDADPLCCCLCRVVKAGTELTWDYSADTQAALLPKQEVPCLCGSNGCQGRFTVEENLCDVCEAEGPGATEAHWSDRQVQTVQTTKQYIFIPSCCSRTVSNLRFCTSLRLIVFINKKTLLKHCNNQVCVCLWQKSDLNTTWDLFILDLQCGITSYNHFWSLF